MHERRQLDGLLGRLAAHEQRVTTASAELAAAAQVAAREAEARRLAELRRQESAREQLRRERAREAARRERQQGLDVSDDCKHNVVCRDQR